MKAKQESNLALALVLVVVIAVAAAFYFGGMAQFKEAGKDIVGRTQMVDLEEKMEVQALMSAGAEGYVPVNVIVKDARVKSVDVENNTVTFDLNGVVYEIKPQGEIQIGERPGTLGQVKQGDKLTITWI